MIEMPPCYGDEVECHCGSTNTCVAEDCEDTWDTPLCCACKFEAGDIVEEEVCEECKEYVEELMHENIDGR